MKGGIGWNQIISGVKRYLSDNYLMFLSRDIDIKLCQNYAKTFICNNIVYKICNIKQIIFNKYATNLKTTISQRSLRNSSLLLLLFELNNFSFLINIIDNIIYASGTCHHNSNQWQCSIIVTCLHLYQIAISQAATSQVCPSRSIWTLAAPGPLADHSHSARPP